MQGEANTLPGSLEAIKVKILISGPDDSPTLVRMELSSEVDLFFHYVHVIDRQGYRIVQEQQRLVVDFNEYQNVLVRMLNSCIREPNNHLAIFLMRGDCAGRLDFIQNMEYKFVELMSCVFERSSEDMVQRHISYRYNNMKIKLSAAQSRLHDIQNLVKAENPSLLLQLQKSNSSNSSSYNSSQLFVIPTTSSKR